MIVHMLCIHISLASRYGHVQIKGSVLERNAYHPNNLYHMKLFIYELSW